MRRSYCLCRARLFAAMGSSVILLVGAVSCAGGTNDSQTQPPSSVTSETDSSNTPATPTASKHSARLPTENELKAALLTSGDLGLKVSTDSDSDGSKVSGCAPLAGILNASSNPQKQQDVALDGGDTGPFVGETLTTEQADTLATDYSIVKKAVTSCKSLAFKSGGTTLRFTLSPIKFGGPDSAGARMDGELDGVQLNGYLAIERLGTVVLGYSFFQVEGGSSQLASTYYRQAVSKVHRVISSTRDTASSDT